VDGEGEGEEASDVHLFTSAISPALKATTVSYNRDFFTIDTIHPGLSFDGIKNILLFGILYMV
jgi:hypothetical protein